MECNLVWNHTRDFNRTSAKREFDFEITRTYEREFDFEITSMISDLIVYMKNYSILIGLE